MGPPPDPENLASMLENPNFASTFNEALSNPDVIEQMIRSNPMFQGPMGQQARQMLQDPNFRRMLTDPTTLRQMNEMRRTMPRVFGGLGGMGAGGGGFPMPGATDTTQPAAGEDAQTGNSTATQVPEGNGPQSPPPNPLAMLGAPGATGGAGANPFAALFGPTGGAAAPTAQGQNQAGGNNAEGTRQARDGAQSQQQPPQLGPQANPFGAMAQQLLQNPQMMQSMLAAMVPPQPNNSDNNDNNNSSNRSAPGQAGAPSFNPLAALMALQQMGGGENPFGAFGDFGGAGAGAGGAGSAAAAPADTRPPEDRYAEQLRQLNEMGFYEFERNVEALRRTGGSVQGAVEYLLTH